MTAAGDQTSILQMILFRIPLSEDHVQRQHLLEQLQQAKRHRADRYQSATGVQANLEICLQPLNPEDMIARFPRGEADYVSLLKFPQKPYGPDRELKEMESSFEGVCQV